MEKDGRLVPGAHAGKKGAGSLKLSPKMPAAGVAKKAKKVAKSADKPILLRTYVGE